MFPKRRFGVAMLAVGTLFFYWAHVGHSVLPKRPSWAYVLYGAFYNPKDPPILKILRDSELLRRSVFTTRPRFTTPWTPLWVGKNACKTQENRVSAGRGFAIANHCAIANLLRTINLLRRSLFSTAGSCFCRAHCFILKPLPFPILRPNPTSVPYLLNLENPSLLK